MSIHPISSNCGEESRTVFLGQAGPGLSTLPPSSNIGENFRELPSASGAGAHRRMRVHFAPAGHRYLSHDRAAGSSEVADQALPGTS